MVGSRGVLVVEPADDRGGLADTLRRKHVSVDAVGDAAAALAAIDTKRFALVLIDPATPEFDAAIFAQALRGIAPRPVVLVIIDRLESPAGYAADVIHGFVRGGNSEQLAELIRDCLAALSGTVSQPVQPAELSLRIPQ